jgi:hypothetical protein
LELLAFISQVLPVDFRAQTGPSRQRLANSRSPAFPLVKLPGRLAHKPHLNISLHRVSFRYIVIFRSAQPARCPDRRKDYRQ